MAGMDPHTANVLGFIEGLQAAGNSNPERAGYPRHPIRDVPQIVLDGSTFEHKFPRYRLYQLCLAVACGVVIVSHLNDFMFHFSHPLSAASCNGPTSVSKG